MTQLDGTGDNAAILVDGSGSLVPSNWVMFDNALFTVRSGGTYRASSWGYATGYCAFSAEPIGGDCVAVPSNVVRYDSPVFAGFSLSAHWGGGDAFLSNPGNGGTQNGRHEMWDVYGRYAGEWNGIKLAATTGWSSQNNGAPGVVQVGLNPDGHVGYWQSGAYVEHVATGVQPGPLDGQGRFA